jgi:L-iditol 2-dehydrogenase
MNSAVYDGKKVEIKQVEVPTVKKDHVLIKIKNSGICGTDLAIIDGHLPTPLPIIPGHEFSGIIEKVGSASDKNLINKNVTCEINSNICGKCYFCKQGLITNCVQRQALGIDINGAFTEYISVPKYLIHPFSDKISFEEATFIEPLAAAVNTFELMPFTENDKNIVIYGAGKLGLLILQVAKHYHKMNSLLKSTPSKVIVVSRSGFKLNLAKKLGADTIIDSSKDDPVKKIKEITAGIGADIVADCTGDPQVLQQIVSSTRTRGKIALKSTHGLPAPINITEIVVRELSLYATRCGPFDKAIHYLDAGYIQLKELINARVNLTDIQEGLKQARSPNVIKVVIANEK